MSRAPAPAAARGAALLHGLAVLMLAAGFVSIAASQIALGLGLALMLGLWVVAGRRPPRTGLEASALALALWALATIPFSTAPATSLLFYRRFYVFAALWVVAAAADGEAARRRLLAGALGGAAGIALYGEIRLVLETGSLFGARFGAMSNPMTSGSLLMMAALLGGGFLLTGGHGRRLRALTAAALLPVVLGLLLTMTRSVLLGLLAGTAVMLLLARRRWFLGFAAAAVLGLVLLTTVGHEVLPEAYQRRLNWRYQVSGANTEVRLEMWRGGWAMVRERPWTGFGDRDLRALGPAYYGGPDTVYHGHLHSNFVQMAAIWGLPGLVLGVVFLVMPMVLLLRRWRALLRAAAAPPALAGWVLGACGAWAGFFTAGFTEWYLGDAETMLIYLAVLGGALGPRSVGTPNTATAGERLEG